MVIARNFLVGPLITNTRDCILMLQPRTGHQADYSLKVAMKKVLILGILGEIPSQVCPLKHSIALHSPTNTTF